MTWTTGLPRRKRARTELELLREILRRMDLLLVLTAALAGVRALGVA